MTRATPQCNAGATVKDALILFRDSLGLHADADYSLFLRQRNADGEDVSEAARGSRASIPGIISRPQVFATLPDVLSAEEAEGLAREWGCSGGRRLTLKSILAAFSPPCPLFHGSVAEHRSLVFKRRIYMPPLTGKEAEAAAAARLKNAHAESAADAAAVTGAPASRGRSASAAAQAAAAADSHTASLAVGHSFALDGSHLPDVDTEAEAATSARDAAHRLAYIEAQYNVVAGNVLVRAPRCMPLHSLSISPCPPRSCPSKTRSSLRACSSSRTTRLRRLRRPPPSRPAWAPPPPPAPSTSTGGTSPRRSPQPRSQSTRRRAAAARTTSR